MNPYKAWLLATRPKTLTGASAPVIVALSAAWITLGHLQWIPATLCILFALFMQIDANLVNDYLDCRDGIDGEDRLGPARACASGWITPRAMRHGIIFVTLSACLTGLPLIYWGGWTLIYIGIACVAGCLSYSILSRHAMGDILVILFFGIVPVCTTYYLQTGTVTPSVWFVSISMGLVTDCLLLVNNYRDRETDLRVGKRTIPNIIGAKATEWLYLSFGFIAFVLCFSHTRFLVFFLAIHLYNWQQMRHINKGQELNRILGKTAAAILFFALLYSAGVIWGI